MRHLPRLTQQRLQDCADRQRPIFAQSNERRWRQLPLGGVGDHAKGGERQIMSGSESRRYMGFHIDRNSARCDMQRTLLRRICNRRIYAGDVNDRRATQRTGETLRPRAIALETAAIFGDDSTRHQWGSSSQSRRQAPGDSEADNSGNILAQRFFQPGFQAHAIAAAGDDGDIRPRGDAGLGDKARHGENRAGLYMPT